MRILHINKYVHERDGVGRYMYDVMRLADAHGHATAVLAMHHEKNNSSVWEDFFVSNLETKKLGRGFGALKQFARTFWSYEAYEKTRKIIRAFKPDVIHAHNLYTHLSPSVLSAARREGIPVVLTAHDYGYISANYGLFDGHSPLPANASWLRVAKTKYIKNSFLATAVVDAIVRTQKIFGMWTRGVSCMLTASQAVKDAMMTGGYSAKMLHVVSLPSGTFAYHETLPKRKRMRRVLFASRFESYKGVDVVMELARRMPDVAFLCAGHGSEEDALRKAAAQQKNISIVSTLSPKKLWELVAESAAVLVPSRWPEPFGLVALESLALGTPAIVSNRGGLPEIVEDGVSGFVLSPDDVESWERAVRTLLPDEAGDLSETQLQRAEAAQVRARKVGELDTHWGHVEGAYRRAIHQKDLL